MIFEMNIDDNKYTIYKLFMCRCYLFDSLTFSNLRVPDHLVGGAYLDEGKLGVF